MIQATSIKQSYVLANARAKFRNLNIALFVVLMLVSLGLSVDIINKTENINQQLLIKLASMLSVIIIFVFYKKIATEKHIVIIEYALITVVLTYLASSVMTTGGVLSPHTSGYYLLLFGSTFILSQRPIDTIVTAISTIVSFGMIYIFFDMENSTVFFTILFFIIITSLLSVSVSYYSERWRLKQFILRYKLIEKNKKIIEMSEIKSNLFNSVSHEFRQPIALINSIIDGVKNNRISSEKIDSIKLNTDILLLKVNNVLDMHKLEKDNLLKLVPINIIAIVKSCIVNLSYKTDINDVSIVLKNEDYKSLYIKGNYYALGEIVTILLVNIIDLSVNDGLVSLNVSIDNDQVKLSINCYTLVSRDSLSLESPIGDKSKLVFVKKLIGVMKGDLSYIDNKRIVEFNIRFPFIKNYYLNDSYTSYSLVSKTDVRRISNNNESSPVLLIVEDDMGLLDYLTDSLKDDFHIYQAMGVSEATDLIHSKEPDIVLTDWMLTDGDGIKICQDIKSNSDFKSMKVVILSAWADEKLETIALESGVDDFIIKPFSKVVLKTRLKILQHNQFLEREMLEKNDELIKIVNDLQSTKIQLIHSEKINAIGSLASGILHEINNPLNYSLAAIQLLQRDKELIKEDDIEIVSDIYNGMLRIKQIVQDLHTFAHPDRVSKGHSFNIKDTIESAVRFSAHELYTLSVIIDVDSSMVVFGSESHIIQVIINFISNSIIALKDTKEGTIKISSVRDGDKVSLYFRDNGAGIDNSTLPRIFEPFFTTKDVGKGLGMGLSISHTIIENHGSTLEVESVLGQYTEFSFQLPLYKGSS